MYEYKVHLHNGEVFIFKCDNTLAQILTELNTCSDGYMRFGEHIRQKNAVVGIDAVIVTDAESLEEETE